MPDSSRLRDRFVSRLPATLGLDMLDRVADVYFFVKDRDRRFVLCNRAFLRLMGVTREQDLIGRRDTDFSPEHLCEKYERDDHAVLTRGVEILDEIELVRNNDGSIDWFSTTKLPVRGRDGRTVIGVAGLTRDLRKMRSSSERFLFMAPVIETIMNEYGRPLPIAELARKVSLSPSQFRRQFKRRFQVTPLDYIRQVRLAAACDLLVATDRTIADIASVTGFYDQSHLTNELARHKGTTPRRYRERYRRG